MHGLKVTGQVAATFAARHDMVNMDASVYAGRQELPAQGTATAAAGDQVRQESPKPFLTSTELQEAFVIRRVAPFAFLAPLCALAIARPRHRIIASLAPSPPMVRGEGTGRG